MSQQHSRNFGSSSSRGNGHHDGFGGGGRGGGGGGGGGVEGGDESNSTVYGRNNARQQFRNEINPTLSSSSSSSYGGQGGGQGRGRGSSDMGSAGSMDISVMGSGGGGGNGDSARKSQSKCDEGAKLMLRGILEEDAEHNRSRINQNQELFEVVGIWTRRMRDMCRITEIACQNMEEFARKLTDFPSLPPTPPMMALMNEHLLMLEQGQGGQGQGGQELNWRKKVVDLEPELVSIVGMTKGKGQGQGNQGGNVKPGQSGSGSGLPFIKEELTPYPPRQGKNQGQQGQQGGRSSYDAIDAKMAAVATSVGNANSPPPRPPLPQPQQGQGQYQGQGQTSYKKGPVWEGAGNGQNQGQSTHKSKDAAPIPPGTPAILSPVRGQSPVQGSAPAAAATPPKPPAVKKEVKLPESIPFNTPNRPPPPPEMQGYKQVNLPGLRAMTKEEVIRTMAILEAKVKYEREFREFNDRVMKMVNKSAAREDERRAIKIKDKGLQLRSY